MWAAIVTFLHKKLQSGFIKMIFSCIFKPEDQTIKELYHFFFLTRHAKHKSFNWNLLFFREYVASFVREHTGLPFKKQMKII